MLLKDKVVIITGVGPGMGRQMALTAAAEGARVAVSARRREFVESVAEEIRADGGQALAVPTDVADMAQCEGLAARTVEAFGRIDGLVNSAYAHDSFDTFEDATIEAWAANMDVTCFGALRMAKCVLPAMKRQKSGAIVNVRAMASVKPFPGDADYATAKGALATATRQLAAEFGKYNIRVNNARIGWLWGPAVRGWAEGAAKEKGVPVDAVLEPIVARIPLGVVPPDDECGKSVLFFVSDYSKMVTGATLDINGGEYMAP